MDKKITTEIIAKGIASALILLFFVVLIKCAFNFTWFQGFVLGYLFWLIQDSIQQIKNN